MGGALQRTGQFEYYATALAVDAAGNVYVTGTSKAGSDTRVDYVTIKLVQNSSGTGDGGDGGIG